MPSLDLDALERALAAMTPRPWRFGALEHGGRYVTDGRGYLFAQVDDDGNGNGLVAAVNATPALIARVRELEGAILDGWEPHPEDVADTLVPDVDTTDPDEILRALIAERLKLARLRALASPRVTPSVVCPLCQAPVAKVERGAQGETVYHCSKGCGPWVMV